MGGFCGKLECRKMRTSNSSWNRLVKLTIYFTVLPFTCKWRPITQTGLDSPASLLKQQRVAYRFLSRKAQSRVKLLSQVQRIASQLPAVKAWVELVITLQVLTKVGISRYTSGSKLSQGLMQIEIRRQGSNSTLEWPNYFQHPTLERACILGKLTPQSLICIRTLKPLTETQTNY
jgi:hypothetical protein